MLLGKKWPNAMWFVPIAIRLGPIKGSKKMSLEDEIRQVLFELGQDIKIHKIDSINMILEIDYDKAVDQIMQLLESSAYDQQ